MQIPLNQFEQYIGETILKRGLQYFKNGYVHEPEEISPGEYETYYAKIEIAFSKISKFFCSSFFNFRSFSKFSF